MIRPQNAEISNYGVRTGTDQSDLPSVVASIAMTDRRREIQLSYECFGRLTQDDQDLAGRASNFRSATRSRQSHRGALIGSDHCRVNICKTIDLCRAEKTDINPAALQPEGKNLTGRYGGVGCRRELAVPDGKRQKCRLGSNRPRLVDQNDLRRVGDPRKVGCL